MALLIIELDKHIGNAKAWRDTFKEQIPDLPIRIWPDTGELRDIEYLAFMHPDFDLLPAFPNLKAMFSRAAEWIPLSNIQNCRRSRLAKWNRQAAIR
jgi:glyoxylate/hydroxypyruvate reductase